MAKVELKKKDLANKIKNSSNDFLFIFFFVHPHNTHCYSGSLCQQTIPEELFCYQNLARQCLRLSIRSTLHDSPLDFRTPVAKKLLNGEYHTGLPDWSEERSSVDGGYWPRYCNRQKWILLDNVTTDSNQRDCLIFLRVLASVWVWNTQRYTHIIHIWIGEAGYCVCISYIMSEVVEQTGDGLARPYTVGTFQTRLDKFENFIKDITYQDVEATPEERRQWITGKYVRGNWLKLIFFFAY